MKAVLVHFIFINDFLTQPFFHYFGCHVMNCLLILRNIFRDYCETMKNIFAKQVLKTLIGTRILVLIQAYVWLGFVTSQNANLACRRLNMCYEKPVLIGHDDSLCDSFMTKSFNVITSSVKAGKQVLCNLRRLFFQNKIM